MKQEMADLRTDETGLTSSSATDNAGVAQLQETNDSLKAELVRAQQQV